MSNSIESVKQRHELIVAVISAQVIANQRELASVLAGYGIEATQATLSRDIKKLGIAKVAGPAGYCFAVLSGKRDVAEQPAVASQPSQTGFRLNSHSHQALLDRVQALEEHCFGRSRG